MYISPRVQDFCTLTIFPLLQVFKTRLKAWANLLLSLIGTINILKMKLLPPFLYVMRHSLVWIPKSICKQFNSHVTSLQWGSCPLDSGYLYYMGPGLREAWPVLISFYTFKLQCSLLDHITYLCSCSGSFPSGETLGNTLFRGIKDLHPLTISMTTVIKAWVSVIPYARNGSRHYSPNTPLWLNLSTGILLYSVPLPVGWQ